MKGPTKGFNDPMFDVKFMAVISHLMGLRPFDDSRGQPRILLSLPYLVVLLSIMCSCTVFMDRFPTSHRTVEKYINLLYIYPSVAKALCLTFLGYYHSKTFHVYKKRMLKVDGSLYKLGVPLKYHRSFLNWMITIIASLSYTVILLYNDLKWFISQVGIPIGVYMGCCYCYTVSVGDVVLLEFVISVSSVRSRYEKVNDLLQDFATDGFQMQDKNNASRALLPVIPLRTNNWLQPRTNIPPSERSSRTEERWGYIEGKNWRLRMIKQVHLELCQASNLLFKIFAAQLALQIRFGVMSITITLYAMYVKIAESPRTLRSLMSCVWPTTYCTMVLVQLFFLSRACERACRVEEKGLSIVHSCYSSGIDTEMKDEIRQFALQMFHCQKGCTKRYLSHLNYSLLSKCVGVISIYLVILIQMDQSAEPLYSSAMDNNTITDDHNYL